MHPQASTIDKALRGGDVRAALAASAAWTQQGELESREVAIEIARAVAGTYRDFVTVPVHEYVEQCESALPADVGPTVAKAVGRLVEMTSEWEPRLRACYEERLARELRDFVRLKDWQPALDNIAALCDLPEDERASGEALRRRVQYVGSVLGTCINHPRESENIIGLVAKNPGQYGLNGQFIAEMEKARKSRLDQMMRANVENIEGQWTTVLAGTQVEVLGKMPGKNLMGDPEEAELRDVGDLFRTILRIPLWRDSWETMLDATLILVDFVPKDTSLAARSSGIEGRSYANLGFRAKKTVAMAFMGLGEIESFADRYAAWAEEQLHRPQKEQIVEFLGALRCERYSPLFMRLWNEKRHRELRPELMVAISNLASPDSAELLLGELASALHKSVIDPPAVRKGESLLASLGRIMRSPRTPVETRKTILDRVFATIPADNSQLAQAAVHSVYSAKSDMLSVELRRQAITTMVESLWIQDQSTNMHKGGERQSNILGARNAAVGALQRLGRDDFDHMLSEFEKRAMRFSGAYMAAAELFEKMKDPRAVPVLSNMLLGAAVQDMGKLSTYQRETYWDATNQERRELGRDQAMAPLVYALGEIGGPDAMRTLDDVLQRIQAGRIENPGRETMEYLGKYVGKDRLSGTAGASRESSPGAVAALPQAEPGEVRELVKALTAKYFLASASKRAQAKIPALARMGQLTPPEGLDAVFQNLVEKDSMIASAALTAASEFAAPGKPKSLIDQTVEKTLDAIESRDAAMRLAAVKLLTEIGPNRPDIRKRVSAFAKSVTDGNAKLALMKALGDVSPADAGPHQPEVAAEDGGGGEPHAREGAPAAVSSSEPAKSALDLKREYMLARQEWIRGGKKGPPPQPPA